MLYNLLLIEYQIVNLTNPDQSRDPDTRSGLINVIAPSLIPFTYSMFEHHEYETDNQNVTTTRENDNTDVIKIQQ